MFGHIEEGAVFFHTFTAYSDEVGSAFQAEITTVGSRCGHFFDTIRFVAGIGCI